ncbi:alpha/beta fold hydrolase [Nocardiopsis trehalosi]|uniref:alpha/beta fold hydrolase n=1 Tax=Nocardiopsis trehalosi TaxID=109329 RepID=UPI000B081021|nr:alpha/beta hydrolase [Nocardiopsis trehalosi]
MVHIRIEGAIAMRLGNRAAAGPAAAGPGRFRRSAADPPRATALLSGLPRAAPPPVPVPRPAAPAAPRLHARVTGPPDAPYEVVCVPGLGCSHRYFAPFARALAPEVRVTAVDLPGFGRSPGPAAALDIRGLAAALADWLRATGRTGLPLVANSMGCQVVVDLAVHAPDVAGPLVLNSPTVDPAARSAVRQLARMARDTIREPPALVPVVARDYLRCGPGRLAATLRHALADPIERKLPNVAVPAVVVRGARDPVVPHAWAAEAARLLPRGHLVEIPGAAHAVNFSTPAPLAHITRTLLPATARPCPAPAFGPA